MLPYGVKFESYDNIPIVEYCVCDKVFVHEQGYVIIDLLDKDANGNTLASTSINLTTVSRLPKPYLRPISSMMQGEWEEMSALIYPHGRVNRNPANKNELLLWLSAEGNEMPIILMNNVFSWLNAHHFDYRGLIEKGLALEAPEGMYEI